MPKFWEEVLKMKAALAGVQGIARAKLLDQLVDTYENKLSNPIDELQVRGKEIISLDADNKAGLKLKYQFRTILVEAEKLAAERKFGEAVAAIEKALNLEGLSSDRKQEILFKRGMYQFSLKDYAAALESLKQASEADAKGERVLRIKGGIAMLTAIIDGQATITKEMEGLEKSAGIERARLLDKLIQANAKLQMYGAAKLTPAEVNQWTAEIVELDADNAAGLKNKYEFAKALREAGTLARTNKFEEGLAAIDNGLALSGITPEQKQEGLMAKGTNYLMQKNYEKSLESFKQAEEAAPQGPRASIIKFYINRVEQQQKKAAGQSKKAESKAEERE
jgi:tetratricopeptide (TPR) repeat protein